MVMYKSVNGETVPCSEEEEKEHLKLKEAFELYEAKEGYKNKRAAEYPPITDYIDGIVKGDQAQVQAYIDACLAVKLKYPK
jgi:hypothetical protein